MLLDEIPGGDQVERVYYPWEEALDDPSLESGMGHDPHPGWDTRGSMIRDSWTRISGMRTGHLGSSMAIPSVALTHLGKLMLGWCPGMFMRLNPKRMTWWGMICYQMTMKIRVLDG